MSDSSSSIHTPVLITLTNLYKKYKGRTVPAVNQLSVSIYQGEILGLLGTNGAGKTTTLSILCGLIKPDSGQVLFQGKENTEALQKKLGIVPQDIALYPTLSIEENLFFFGNLQRIPHEECKTRIDRWLSRFELSDFRHYLVEKLSGGQKRKANLIAALLHAPEFLILDEPTVGVDIQSRRLILEVLQELNQQGLTILYTSHYLEEAEKLCHRIVVLDEGKIVAQGTPAELAAMHSSDGGLDYAFLQITQKKML